MRHDYCVDLPTIAGNTPVIYGTQDMWFAYRPDQYAATYAREEVLGKVGKLLKNVTYITQGTDFVNNAYTGAACAVLKSVSELQVRLAGGACKSDLQRKTRPAKRPCMPHFSSLSDEDLKRYLGLVEQSLKVRRHFDLLLWLQGDVQRFLPHEVMLAGWGDFRIGMIAHDIVSAVPGVRTARVSMESVSPLLASLFQRWIELGRAPYVLKVGAHGLEAPGGTLEGDLAYLPGGDLACLPGGDLGRALKSARSALIHGICDERGRHDCLYVLFSQQVMHNERARKVLDLLLPYLDTALRQVPQLRVEPAPAPEEAQGDAAEHGLSDREMEIMAWVKLGKTNQEIGMILDISAFTVKNHLKRIFRKLGVYNRMQAVSRFEAMISHVAN